MYDSKKIVEDLKDPALTPSQKEYGESNGAFRKYRRLVSGGDSNLCWILVELYNLLIAPIPSILGIILRSLVLPLLLSSGSKIPKIEKNVSIRSPKRVKFGDKVIVDQSCVLDARSDAAGGRNIIISDNCFIGAYSLILAKRGDITLARGANISTFCRIASEGNIYIGESVLVSAYCYIGPGNHVTSDLNTPIANQGMEDGVGVRIGDNSWIGAHSTILDGVTIGKNVVVGAYSFVREDVPDNVVVAGIPAKVIKTR